MSAMSPARAPSRSTSARKLSSERRPNSAACSGSWVKLLTVLVALSVSVAIADRSASASWVRRDMRRSRRANQITGMISAGAMMTTASAR